MSGIILPDDPHRLPWSMTLGELVDRAVSRDPYKVYLHYGPYQVTYQELLDYTLRVAGLFRDLGVGRGDRVCVFLPTAARCLSSGWACRASAPSWCPSTRPTGSRR